MSTTSTRPRPDQGITGRDGYLVWQALAYAIIAIEQRPREFQEHSNKEAMRLLLAHHCPGQWSEVFLDNAKRHLTGVGHSAGDGKVITLDRSQYWQTV